MERRRSFNVRCAWKASERVMENSVAGIDWHKLGASVSAVVKTVIGDQFRLYGRVLPEETDLIADLGSVDDIEVLEVLMTMEELFNLRFDPEVTNSIRTVGDVVTLVERELEDLQRNSSASPGLFQ
jgi:acyl carrier protein